MKNFNVLDRSLKLHQHYLLEASAGTGKTFSIQNIVVRLLIESHGVEEPLLIHNILIVTFTRAATRDLKFRIRTNIEQALSFLNSWMNRNDAANQAPDYLQACMEKGEEYVQDARKKLQQALFAFDQAQIFTIHSFCARMLRQFALESDMGLQNFTGEEPLPQSEIMTIIRDFFRTEVRLDHYSPIQLEMILNEDPNQKKLLKAVQSGYDFPLFQTFKEVYIQFAEIMQNLKKNLSLTSDKMLSDFQSQASSYRNYKQNESKAQTFEKIVRFAHLFDKCEWNYEDLDVLISDGIVWVKALNPKLHKGKKSIESQLIYPGLTEILKQSLFPLIEKAGDYSLLLARMARDCQKLLKRYQLEEEKLSPDDILRKMHKALEQPSFLEQVQMSYGAAIIDEFQDTDPLQWQIFRRLFIPDEKTWKGYLYLVGDPKQSIYSFRQADIYTYLEAAQALGESHCFSLDVNYRSQPQLVQALNALFNSENLPQFIPLPKQSFYLPYQSVHSSNKEQRFSYDGSKGAIHFFIADGQAFKKPKITDLETHVFFPFIAKEITEIKKRNQLSFRQFAVLVRDRHQATRLAKYLKQQGICSLNQRGTSLVDSPALQALIDMIRAILQPQDRGAIRVALGSPLMGWNHEDLKKVESIETTVAFIQKLRSDLFEKGFATFFQQMLRSNFGDSQLTIQQQILDREGGLEFYRDLQQIADIVVDHQYQEWNSPEGIISFLDRFKVWDENDDERVKQFQDPTMDGVKILTLHFSKGLEFEVVFALGLVNRPSFKEDLFPIELNGQMFLTPLIEDSEEHQRYCEENDAEKMRQLYVALTRAKYQLFIPVALHFPSDHLKWGEASPMDLLLARLQQNAPESHQVLYERIKLNTGENLLHFLDEIGQKNFITYSIHQEVPYEVHHEIDEEKEKNLKPPSNIVVTSQPLWMASFSTLSQKNEHQHTERLSLGMNSPCDFKCHIKDVHTLPANHSTGILIHHILEKLTFKDFHKLTHFDQAISLIRPFVVNTSFKEWEAPIAEMVYNTLKTTIPMGNSDFCLAHLEQVHIYREMSFIFPYKRENGIQEIDFMEGLIKGVMDLLYFHNGYYYLVDWKTNWLGLKAEAYEKTFLHAAMQENAYFLQAAIYKEAIKRYLKIVEPRPFEECFGGAFYLFLRGLKPSQETGIYHFFPN